MSQPSTEQPNRRSLSDSPWFWVMLFSAVGVLLLLAISPKYARRQARLELQYQAHEEKARRQVVGEGPARDVGEEGSAPPPSELIIPLWPVIAIFAALSLVSAAVLARSPRGDEATPRSPSGGGPP